MTRSRWPATTRSWTAPRMPGSARRCAPRWCSIPTSGRQLHDRDRERLGLPDRDGAHAARIADGLPTSPATCAGSNGVVSYVEIRPGAPAAAPALASGPVAPGPPPRCRRRPALRYRTRLLPPRRPPPSRWRSCNSPEFSFAVASAAKLSGRGPRAPARPGDSAPGPPACCWRRSDRSRHDPPPSRDRASRPARSGTAIDVVGALLRQDQVGRDALPRQCGADRGIVGIAVDDELVLLGRGEARREFGDDRPGPAGSSDNLLTETADRC